MITKKKLILFLAGATFLMSGCTSKDLSETPLTIGSKAGEMSEMRLVYSLQVMAMLR